MDHLDRTLDKATPEYIKYLRDEGFEFLPEGIYRHPENLCIQITPIVEIGHGHKEPDQDKLIPTDTVEITFYKCDTNEVLRENETIDKQNLKTTIEKYLIENKYIEPPPNVN